MGEDYNQAQAHGELQGISEVLFLLCVCVCVCVCFKIYLFIRERETTAGGEEKGTIRLPAEWGAERGP